MRTTVISCLIALTMTSVVMADLGEGKTAEEIAKELANPNTPLSSLKFRLQYRDYDGDLPSADGQDSFTLMFQPTLPFPSDNGRTLFFRPAIPLLIGQPVYDADSLDFSSANGLGDMVVDLQYGTTTESGFLWSVGATFTMPTSTEDGLGNDRWSLGPGFQLGQVGKKSVLGGFINHQWDVAGSGEKIINLTTAQFFAVYLPGGGWNLGSAPTITYDHETDGWSIPLHFVVGKTVIKKGRPWKFALELNYYVERPDAFAPEWMVSFNIAPVVVNGIAKWFG